MPPVPSPVPLPTPHAQPGESCPTQVALLYHRLLAAGLAWFGYAPSYSARMTQRQADEQYMAVEDFAAQLAVLTAGAERGKRWPDVTVQAAYQPQLNGPSGVAAEGGEQQGGVARGGEGAWQGLDGGCCCCQQCRQRHAQASLACEFAAAGPAYCQLQSVTPHLAGWWW